METSIKAANRHPETFICDECGTTKHQDQTTTQPALFAVVDAFCKAMAASGVDPVEDSNDPIEALFNRALKIRAKVLEG